MKRFFAILLIAVIILPCFVVNAAADSGVTVLFTHDLHSHFLPATDEDGNQYGGYATLSNTIKEAKERYPDALVVDAGDFSMGSLFQTAYATSALELRIMGKMGYDVTTFGNHEFDYLPKGLAGMLGAAKNSGDPLPQIVISNYQPSAENGALQEAMDNYGVREYTVIERGGNCFVVFGIFGIDADDCAPNSGMVLQDMAKTAQSVVDRATKEVQEKYGADPFIVCLSHSGTEDGKGEDYELAKAVDGIDLIVSGHTHTTLEKPIEVNGTYIVSAGEYGKNLGVAHFEGDSLTSYRLSSNTVTAPDREIEALVESYKQSVETDYLSDYGFGFDEVVVNNRYTFDTVNEVYATQHESTLGNVFSDAYKWAVEEETGQSVDIALTAAGVIRESLPKGDVTVSDVFNAASLGVGTEGELVSLYITGRDLKNALEVDASVQPLMSSAQLFCSGVKYSFNTKRMIFNKIDEVSLIKSDGTYEKIEDDKLYNVVTGMYVGQMLGSVKETSMGLLSIVPRDKDGNPISADEFVNHTVKTKEGKPLKEWYAISSYLKSMGGDMDEKYSAPDGRKVVYSSLAPADLLRNSNKFTYILIAVVVILIAVITFVTLIIIKKIKKKK